MGGWQASDIPALEGKTFIVTGADSGIGLEATRVLVARGAHVIMACRHVDVGEAVAATLPAGKGRAEVRGLDLGSLRSVRAFAKALDPPVIDVLLNNAGVMLLPYGTTEDDFEQQFGINHLGHFALTSLLLPRILAAPRGRIVHVASLAHRHAHLDFDNLQYTDTRGYTGFQAYARSKLANLLFTFELQRRLEAAGERAIALAAHPGVAATNFGGRFAKHGLGGIARRIGHLFGQSAAEGALPLLRATTAPDALGAEYYGASQWRECRGPPERVDATAEAHNCDIGRRLWEASEAYTDEHFSSLSPCSSTHPLSDNGVRRH